MASTFDNDLRLEEMATGENAGSWGTKTNTNLELIADAFGYGTFTIANADTTLTMPDGSDTDNALRSLYLKINSSADLTTTRVLTLAPNSVSKLWYIENNTSGGQTITISQGSGANVSILNGQAKLVATDGGLATAAVIDLTDDLAIKDLFVDENISMQSDGAVINFGADAEIQLTHVADTGLLLTETGGGAPTLQIRDSALSISSSADGQLDIDADTEIEIVAPTVDIDASTAMTVDTTTFTVTGNTVLDGDLTVDTDTLYVDSTNDLVGIGNSTPSSYNTGSNNLVIGNGGSNGISIHAGVGMLHFTNGADTTERVSIKSTVASNTLEFTTGGSEAMRIDSSQRVLIGTNPSSIAIGSTAQAIMQVHQNATTVSASFGSFANNVGGPVISLGHSRNTTVGTAGAIVSSGDSLGTFRWAGDDGTDMVTQAAKINVAVDGTPGSNDMPGRLEFYTTADGSSSSTERWRITSTGNLLNPGGYLIGVNTSDGSDNSYIAFGAGSGESDGRGAIIRAYGNEHASNAGLLSLSGGNVTGGAISFRAGGTDAMKVDDNGTVLVGFTADNSTQGGRLQVNTDAVIRRNLAGSGAGALRLEHNRSNTDGNFTVVQSGDKLGEIQWYGSDSVDFALGAQLIATVDGGAASNDMPTRLSFLTAADGTASPTEHMRISENGHIGMGNSPVGSFDSEKVFINTDGSFGTEIALSLNNPRAYGIGLGTSAVALDFVRARSTGDDNYQMARITGYNEAETSSADGGMAIYTRNGGSLEVAINITSDGDVSNRQNSDGGGTNAYQIGASVAGNYMSDANGATEARIKSARFPGTGGGVTSGAGWVITTGANTYAPYGKDTDDPTVAIQSRGMQIVKGGIQFGNAVGSWTTANVLDDYEEGTWTPTIKGSTSTGTGTYTIQEGYYRKVGQLIFVSAYITWTAHTGTGQHVFVLPFTPNAGGFKYSSMTIGYANNVNWGASNTSPNVHVAPNLAEAFLGYSTNNAAWVATSVDTAGSIIFSGCYSTA